MKGVKRIFSKKKKHIAAQGEPVQIKGPPKVENPFDGVQTKDSWFALASERSDPNSRSVPLSHKSLKRAEIVARQGGKLAASRTDKDTQQGNEPRHSKVELWLDSTSGEGATAYSPTQDVEPPSPSVHITEVDADIHPDCSVSQRGVSASTLTASQNTLWPTGAGDGAGEPAAATPARKFQIRILPASQRAGPRPKPANVDAPPPPQAMLAAKPQHEKQPAGKRQEAAYDPFELPSLGEAVAEPKRLDAKASPSAERVAARQEACDRSWGGHANGNGAEPSPPERHDGQASWGPAGRWLEAQQAAEGSAHSGGGSWATGGSPAVEAAEQAWAVFDGAELLQASEPQLRPAAGGSLLTASLAEQAAAADAVLGSSHPARDETWNGVPNAGNAEAVAAQLVVDRRQRGGSMPGEAGSPSDWQQLSDHGAAPYLRSFSCAEDCANLEGAGARVSAADPLAATGAVAADDWEPFPPAAEGTGVGDAAASAAANPFLSSLSGNPFCSNPFASAVLPQQAAVELAAPPKLGAVRLGDERGERAVAAPAGAAEAHVLQLVQEERIHAHFQGWRLAFSGLDGEVHARVQDKLALPRLGEQCGLHLVMTASGCSSGASTPLCQQPASPLGSSSPADGSSSGGAPAGARPRLPKPLLVSSRIAAPDWSRQHGRMQQHRRHASAEALPEVKVKAAAAAAQQQLWLRYGGGEPSSPCSRNPRTPAAVSSSAPGTPFKALQRVSSGPGPGTVPPPPPPRDRSTADRKKLVGQLWQEPGSVHMRVPWALMEQHLRGQQAGAGGSDAAVVQSLLRYHVPGGSEGSQLPLLVSLHGPSPVVGGGSARITVVLQPHTALRHECLDVRVRLQDIPGLVLDAAGSPKAQVQPEACWLQQESSFAWTVPRVAPGQRCLTFRVVYEAADVESDMLCCSITPLVHLSFACRHAVSGLQLHAGLAGAPDGERACSVQQTAVAGHYAAEGVC